MCGYCLTSEASRGEFMIANHSAVSLGVVRPRITYLVLASTPLHPGSGWTGRAVRNSIPANFIYNIPANSTESQAFTTRGDSPHRASTAWNINFHDCNNYPERGQFFLRRRYLISF